jgi:hypothetical protein
MLARTFALWLVVLILLPFSAPFSTCDLATVFSPAAGRHQSADPVRTHAPIASPFDTANTHVLPLARVTARGKFVALEMHSPVAGAAATRAHPYQTALTAGFVRSPFSSPLRI